MTTTIRRLGQAVPLPGDTRPVGLWCFGCGTRYVPKGTPKPHRDGDGNPAVAQDEWQWREILCDDPDCPANTIAKGLRR